MTREEINRYETTCRSLMKWTKCKLLHEQDTIERLIVPILRSVGWNVDCVDKPQLVRGNRDNKSDHRSFDLNVYKDVDGLNLSIAIECKEITMDFLPPDLEVQKILACEDSDVENQSKSRTENNESRFHWLGQLLRDYLDEQFGRVKSGANVINGQTMAIWTNGRTWVLVRGEKDRAEFRCQPCRIKSVPVELVECVAPRSQSKFVFANFLLFNQDGEFDGDEYNQLAEELRPDAFLNAPYEG